MRNFECFFSYIQSVPLAHRKELCPMLIVYFEDKFKGFLKRIPLYFLNAWLERYPKIKLTNFDQNAKISQLQVLVGNIEADPRLFRKLIFGHRPI